MNRLTGKINENNNYAVCCPKQDKNALVDTVQNCINKLGKLEDLEEELGCPLDIFVNIMLGKITEVVINYSDAAGYDSLYEELVRTEVSGIIESYNYPNCLCLETNLCDVPIKDYHKNWWLKGEKDNDTKI